MDGAQRLCRVRHEFPSAPRGMRKPTPKALIIRRPEFGDSLLSHSDFRAWSVDQIVCARDAQRAMKTFALAFAAVLLTNLPAFSEAPKTRQIDRKLANIVIPHLDLRDVTVEQAFAILQQKAKALDPDGAGVNFVLKIPGADGTPVPALKK